MVSDNNGGNCFFWFLGKADGISHVTHISGMLIGYALLKNKWKLSDVLFSLRKKQLNSKFRERRSRVKEKIINRDVDIILEKIKDVGFSGLSDEEQSKLYEASKKMSKDGDRD